MGGRGIHALNSNKQLTLTQVLQQNEVNNIRENFQQICLSKVGSGSAPISKQPLLKRCACCKQYTLPAFSQYLTCKVCGWIDDPEQNSNPTSSIGRNPLTLREAQESWKNKAPESVYP